MKRDVKINHCLINGKLRRVSDFAHLAPKDRPPAICWECENVLVLKLGKSGKRIHHAAHKTENSGCYLTSPEGALHFNTKVYIYEQLKRGIDEESKLFIKQTCTGWALPGHSGKTCSRFIRSSRPFLWLENWDTVQMEKNVQNQIRPDIVLYRDGQPVAGIEVCVTHAVDDLKKIKLRAIGLPWIEVKADGDRIDEYFVDWAGEIEDFGSEHPWKIEKPLIYENCHPLPEDWVCDRCLTAPAEYAEQLKRCEEEEALNEARVQSDRLKRIHDEQEEKRRQVRYLQTQDNQIIKAKAVVLLKSFGEFELLELFVIRRDNPEPPYAPEELYLKLGRRGGEILISEEPLTVNSNRVIWEFFKTWVKSQEKRYQKLCDATDWLDIGEYEKAIANYIPPLEWKRLREKVRF